ncbi:MAG TPA: hydrogenase maturation protease [Acidimicrobiales bacterium]|nr:hydrogenase maturation protease [Acidimicrobiales bacterium]
MSASRVVAGLGNEYRCDDGAGVLVARAVAAAADGVADVGPISEPLELLGRWDGSRLAIVVDTVRSGAEPGTVRVVELDEGVEAPVLVGARTTSTHGMGFSLALRLARSLGVAPERVVLVAIEGSVFEPGLGVSAALSGGIEEATSRIMALLEEPGDV